MGKGKRRNTAKTGDKSLYKKVAESRKATTQENHDDDDNMYNSVDQFHNQREEEFLKLDGDAGQSESHDSDEEQEAVMDLGVGGISEEEDEGDDSDDDGSKEPPKQNQVGAASSSSEDEDDEQEVEDVRDWGRKKSAYYHGDTADLELGQDEEDAFMEEEAAKDVQAARLMEMDEADFILSDDEDEQNRKSKQSSTHQETVGQQTSSSRLSSIRDVSKLGSKERRKLLEKQHPGLQQILSHFKNQVQDLQGRTSLATRALFQGEDDGTAEVCTLLNEKMHP
jgi:U3 small nucleolar RNA-associated protein 3